MKIYYCDHNLLRFLIYFSPKKIQKKNEKKQIFETKLNHGTLMDQVKQDAAVLERALAEV